MTACYQYSAGSIILSYLLGSIPFGFIAVRLVAGTDIRKYGSGNIGATNAIRVLGEAKGRIGKAIGYMVFLLDVAKGFIPAYVFPMIFTSDKGGNILLCSIAYGISAIMGHLFPVFLLFKGGKGVATSAGVFLGLTPVSALLSLLTWLIVTLLSRYVSLGSITAAVMLPVFFILTERGKAFNEKIPLTFACLIVCLIVIIRHRENIKRLLAGTENKIGGKKE